MQNLEDPNYWKSLINIGLSKFFVLKILYEKPTHGYGILKKLTELTEGCCVPTFGSIYPILAKLTKEGYTKILNISNANQGRKKKIYTLTPKGKKTYKIAMESWRTSLPYICKAIDCEYENEKIEKNVQGNRL
jgi:DNA-binding PadR family transcriptional regulator